MVTTATNPSGIAATANEIANNTVSNMFFPFEIFTPIIIKQIRTAINPKILLNSFILFCKGVKSSRSSFNKAAILPISVFIPQLTAIPLPLPLLTYVDINTILCFSEIDFSLVER